MPERAVKRQKTGDDPGRIVDPRFANIHSDPRYRLPSKKQKVKLDKRFKTAFQGDDFVRRAKVDRYGRPVEDDADRRRLEKKFDLDENDEELSDDPDDDEEVQKELARIDQKHDPLREGKLDASSSEEESSSDEDSLSEEDDVEELEATQKEDVPIGEVSSRLAIVNLDWDNIRAEDLMAVFSSFLPSAGRLLDVAVYPSEFGKERMEREEMQGPPKEIFAAQKRNGSDEHETASDTDSDKDEDDEDIKASIIKPDDGSEFDSQALRQYQLERLRYFYAVLSFSSKSVAKAIYEAVDGTEYLSTANFFDLRFIPDDMDFSDDKPRDHCHRLPTEYKPTEFVTDALQHSKVKLTWDQEDRGRKEAQARAFKGGQKEIDENDLKAYLGSDSSSSDGEEEDASPTSETATKSKKDMEREKARALLGLSAEPAKKSSAKDKNTPLGNIQVTFSSGLAGSADPGSTKRSIFENSPEPDETTTEKYLRKERERKQRRKDKMKAAKAGTSVANRGEGEDEGADHDNESANPMQDDLMGFDDPFFDDANLVDNSGKNKVRKEERLKKKRDREAEEAASAKQRAELELIMAEDDDDAAHATGAARKGTTVRHFDISEIERAQKKKNKKDRFKKNKNKNESAGAVNVQDDFQMNVSDPRFGKLFENHEFAIDPTNQKLKQTDGMKELLDESRKRKARANDLQMTENLDQQKRDKTTKRDRTRNNEVQDLIAKVKRRTT